MNAPEMAMTRIWCRSNPYHSAVQTTVVNRPITTPFMVDRASLLRLGGVAGAVSTALYRPKSRPSNPPTARPVAGPPRGDRQHAVIAEPEIVGKRRIPVLRPGCETEDDRIEP